MTKKRYTKDDEFVAKGFIHVERMSRTHIWMNLAGHSFDLRIQKGKITFDPQDPEELRKFQE